MEGDVEHFEVKVVEISIEKHDNADSLELAIVNGYVCVVRKDIYKNGQLAVYIPEQSILPVQLVDKLVQLKILPDDAQGKEFIVKPMKLRGVLSQGILSPLLDQNWTLDMDVKKELNITKWEPPVAPFLKLKTSGNKGTDQYIQCQPSWLIKYDIEHYKKYNKLFVEGEEVVFCEKVHGTWCQIGYLCKEQENGTGNLIVTSKGLAKKGVAFIDNEENRNENLYLKVAYLKKIPQKIQECFKQELEDGNNVYILGEIFGAGIQDLSYGFNEERKNKSKDTKDCKDSSTKEIGFNIFDIFIGIPSRKGGYLDYHKLKDTCEKLQLPMVPSLYVGPFSHQVVKEYTNGKETVSGKSLHIREGIVIRPVKERYEPKLGRLQLKNVSEAYLLRKGGTEYN